MKKLLTLIFIGILFTNCSSSDDNEIDCSLFDPVFPEIYIRLVDETGVNLLENGAIDPENITVEGDFSNPGFRFISPKGYDDVYLRNYDNTLYLLIPNKSNFEYTINLDDSTSIILNFEARFAELLCGISYYIPTKLTYNNKNIDSENKESNELIFFAEIEL